MTDNLPRSAIGALFSAVTSHAQSLAVFRHPVTQHEPMNAPGQGLSCAILLGSVKAITGSGLNSTSGRVDFLARIYNPFREGADQLDDIDPDLLDATSQLLAAYCGDLTLALGTVPAGLVRNVDIRGQYGAPLSAQPGYLQQQGKIFRTMDATIGILLNDIWSEVTQ